MSKILFYEEECPEYVFEWYDTTHGVNVYWKKEYENDEKLTVDYFSFDFDLDKVSYQKVKEHIADKVKEYNNDS